ncbi:hypothetical protein FZC76_04550 [Sutcliffiella horikoshii]|uniref:Flavoprotein domain-containing protein n=1 Tax=Sutcliffiella horikoshii TaxID=79883 RepID=A0A5D4T1D9_9BACI|nr:hypothetical protein [Sutcliffiella horikoshii]TYS69510.1 hypothetical protein FZC76_04550 [Sutcliffiella horikoshii]
MDVQEKVKELVRQAVKAYMSGQGNGEKMPTITVLLNYHSSNPELILKAVTEIKQSFAVKLVASKDWEEQLDGEQDVLSLDQANHRELENLWNTTDLLILPVASFQLVSKLALMVDDDSTSHTAIQFQLLGKPIVIANNEVELGVYQQILAPHSVQEKLQGYLRTTQKDHVKWVPLNQLVRTAKEQHQQYKEKQPLILAKHIEHAARGNIKTITVPKKSKITPVAKDMARELKIHIEKEHS